MVLSVAWYRFRTTFAVRWGGYLTVVLLVTVMGGLAMGAVAAARRTQSSFPTFLASTNPSDLRIGTAAYNPAVGSDTGYDSLLVRRISHLPNVRRVENAALLNVVPYLGPSGAPGPTASPALGDPTGLNMIGSIDGLYFDEDRITITKGRMPDPARADEVVLQASTSKGGPRLGQVIAVGVYTNAAEARPGFTTANAPYRRVDVRVVGLGVSNDAVVTDDVDAGGSFLVLFTPAFTRSFLACCARATPDTAIQVSGGSRSVAAVENQFRQIWQKAGAVPSNFYVSSVTVAKAERAIKPESTAIGIFGAIVGLATLLVAGQAIGRQLDRGADDLPVLRAFGASRAMNASDGMIGIGCAILLGALLAIPIAIALSPLAPIGVVRPVYPSAGVAEDWTVLAFGSIFLSTSLVAVALLLADRQATVRSRPRRSRSHTRRLSLGDRAAAAGLPAPAVLGIRFAVDPVVGRTTVPVRSSILGLSLAVIVVTATLTFGASLHALVSHPALYGWNWNYELAAGGGTGDIPEQQAAQLLDHDPAVAAWAGVYFGTLEIDGKLVPVLGASPGARVSPPMLSGHAFESTDQVVLGNITLAQLHKRIGDTVSVSSGGNEPHRLRIVGTASMPAIGSNFGQHLEMGIGALLSYGLIPPADRNVLGNPVTGPNAILVRLRVGASISSLQQIATATSTTSNGGVSVDAVQRPAEIVNYRSLGATPALLGAALAGAVAFAFGLTLIASVRRRRRDLAVLKTIGLVRSQLAAVVAWQSSVAVAIGEVAGIPIGIVLGRYLWDLFAQNIDAVPDSTIPTASLTMVAIGAVILANIVAAVPGVIAGRTSAANLLPAE